jgi:hypothetical protein
MLVALVLTVYPMATLPAQAHLSVDLKDPVYQLLEAAELRGALGTLSAVRPYSRSQVIALLDRLWEVREMLSDVEKAVLAETRQRFGEERDGLRYGNLAHHPVEKSAKRLAIGVDVQTSPRLNVNSTEDWYLDSAFRPYLRGDLSPWLSYLGILGFTFDRVASEEEYDASHDSPAFPPSFAPYEFTKQWDGYHISFGAERYTHGEMDYPTISYDLETEITAELMQDDVRVSFARQRREWGIGDGSLTLSGSARPFVGAETHVKLAPWITGHYLFGTLSNWDKEPEGILALGPYSYQKLFALQRLELTPFPWLYLSASSSVLGARRFELTYLSPLLFGVLAQNLIGDLDNVGAGVDVAVTLPPFGRAYASFFADEMELTNLRELFTRPRNMFALQGGLKLPVPRLPFTDVTLQYTRIEPFTYAHYYTQYPDYRLPVDTAYTHDGENLAYHLWPNSDEFLVKLASLPFQGFRAGLEYRLIRHGDNPSKVPGDFAILGRPDGYLDYTVGSDNYPDKDFLHDGLYDFNHIVTVSGEYSIPETQITVGLSYTFSYTYWEVNASGETDPGDIIRNIIGLKVKVFR